MARQSSRQTNNAQHLLARYATQFGMKTPAALIAFLNSPAGETLAENIAGDISNELETQKKLTQQERDKALLQKRREAFLLFVIFNKNHTKARQKLEQAINDIEKILHPKKPNQPEEELRPLKINQKRYEQAITPYIQSLEHSRLALDTLEADLKSLTEQHQQIDKKYEKYETAEHSMQTWFSDHANEPTLMQSIDDEMAKLTKQIEEDAETIQAYVDKNQLDEARTLIQKSTADNLKIAMMKDLKSTMDGDKICWNEQGEPTDFKHARFILPKAQKIVKQNDTLYLLKADQNITELSADEKTQASEAFKRLKPNLSSIKQLLKHNHTSEKQDNQVKIEAVRDKQTEHQTNIIEASKQIEMIQSDYFKPSPLNPSPISLQPLPTATPNPDNTPTPKK